MMVVLFFFGCSASGTSSARSAKATSGDEAACSQSRAVIDIGIGWTIEEARERSTALALITPELANWAPAAYVYEPKRVKLEGSIPLEIPCPHMVVVTPRNGRVLGVEIDLTPTSDLDAAMKLMETWHSRFESMQFDRPPARLSDSDQSPEELRAFFHMVDARDGPIGGDAGSWRRGSEVVSIGIEKRNIGSISQPRYIYVVDLSVSDVSMWISK